MLINNFSSYKKKKCIIHHKAYYIYARSIYYVPNPIVVFPKDYWSYTYYSETSSRALATHSSAPFGELSNATEELRYG